MKSLVILIVAVAASGCASTPSQPALPTVVTFERVHIDKVATAFAIACSHMSGRIVSQSTNQLECARPMGNSFKEAAYKALATEQYASNPDFHFQWAFMQSGDGVDVTVSSTEWIEHQNAFGKTTRDSVQGGEAAQIMSQIHDAAARTSSN